MICGDQNVNSFLGIARTKLSGTWEKISTSLGFRNMRNILDLFQKNMVITKNKK